MDATTIGRVVQESRRAAGMTQAELARRIGTTQPAISKIESGRTLPGIDLLERVARATGRPFTLTFGSPHRERVPGALVRDRVRRALGRTEFDPWERGPTPAEQESLLADGLTRERFAS
jgi:transcriptional regulator with XRE-family HTH domain